MFAGGFEVFDDFLSENVGIGKIVGVFEAFVYEPENVEAGLVAAGEFFMVERPAAHGEKTPDPLKSSPEEFAAG